MSTASPPAVAAVVAGFDGVIANYAARVNGLTDIALTKLDVLSAFETIKVCVAYECNGVRYTTVPEHEQAFTAATPGVRGRSGLVLRYFRLPHLRRAAQARATTLRASRSWRTRAFRL